MKQVNVAIIDSGIQLNALCESARNNTQNGYIINGGTVLSIAGIKRDRLEDHNGHGTACASVIHRIAPGAKLIHICILGQNGRCSSRQLINALELVKNFDVQIVNMSISSNDIKIRRRINKLVTELQEQGKICVASQSNDRWISYPAELRKVLGVAGSPAVFSEEYLYDHDKKIQIVASGAAELMKYKLPRLCFFRGNSRAAAIISGILANALSTGDMSDSDDLEKYLLTNVCDRQKLFRKPDMESRDQLIYKEVYMCVKKLISREVIHVRIDQSGNLADIGTLDDYYRIIHTLESDFSCNIFGKKIVYKRYFESVEYLSSLIEGLVDGECSKGS